MVDRVAGWWIAIPGPFTKGKSTSPSQFGPACLAIVS